MVNLILNKDATFNDTSPGTPTSFDWDFGDGTLITGTTSKTAVHRYVTSGTYTVTHNVYSCGTKTTCSQIMVVSPPAQVSVTVSVSKGGYSILRNQTLGVEITILELTTKSMNFTVGDTFLLTAYPTSGYQFTSICAPTCAPTNPITGTINTSGSVQVNFSPSCVPLWKCKYPLDGTEEDGCGSSRPNSACNPCVSSWHCRFPLDGTEEDGCGNSRPNSACNPAPQTKQFQLYIYGNGSVLVNGIRYTTSQVVTVPATTETAITPDPDTGETLIKMCIPNDDFHCTTSTSTQFFNPMTASSVGVYFTTPNPCVPDWQCKVPLDGTEEDGCGNSRTNPVCIPPEICPKDPIGNFLCSVLNIPPPPGYPMDLPAMPELPPPPPLPTVTFPPVVIS